MGGSPGAIWFLMKKRNQIKSLSANKERCFSTKDHPPVLPVETKQQRLNMISAINSQGQVRFMIYQETMNHTNH